MPTELSEPFVWREHILPLEGRMLDRFAGKGTIGAFLRRKLFGETPEGIIGQYNLNWKFLQDFFDNMTSQNYCKQEYIVKHWGSGEEDYFLEISGSGLEEFSIDGNPSFVLENGKRKTRIPVEKDSDDFEIVLLAHPQAEINPALNLGVDYSFKVRIPLGGNGISWFTDAGFTKKVAKTSICDRKCLFGKPGQVYYRPCDYLFEQLSDYVFGNFFVGGSRKKLYIGGTVHNGASFLYNGQIDSTGTFPFFIRKGKRGGERDIAPVATTPSAAR